MSSPVRSLILQKVTESLNARSVVVWYDPKGELASVFEALALLGMEKVDARGSMLRARRLADQLWSSITAPAARPPFCTRMVIYVPWARATTEEGKLQEPFEAYACVGAAFGADPGESLASLARQAMPQREAQIDALFAEKRAVTLEQLEALAAPASYPLLRQAFGTDDPTEIAARLIATPADVMRGLSAAGVQSDLTRLLGEAFGFEAPDDAAALRLAFVRWVLFSEFAFDVDDKVPDHTAGIGRAAAPFRGAIFAVCDRVRGAEAWRDAYIEAANEVAKAYQLETLPGEPSSWGDRDTFAAEDGAALLFVQAECLADKVESAQPALENRKHSIWLHDPARAQLWQLAARALDLLLAARRWRERAVTSARPVRDHVIAYASDDGGLWQVDRAQRWMERAAGDCMEREILQPLVERAQLVYRQTIDGAQGAFLEAVTRDGWPPDGPKQVQVFARHVAPALQDGARVAYFLVDALRFEMGRDLCQKLEKLGTVRVESTTTVVPTTTAFGMAALLPGADASFGCAVHGGDLVPTLGGKVTATADDRKERFRELFGDRFVDLRLDDLLVAKDTKLRERVGRASLLVVRSDDIDSVGERLSSHSARRFMSSILDDVTRVAERLAREGVKRMVFAADHGHVLLHEVPPGDVVRAPPGQWVLEKRRSRLGMAAGEPDGVRVMAAETLGIQGPVRDVALATGFRVFAAGTEYFHEGVSLQECVVPTVVLDVRSGSVLPPAGPTHVDVVTKQPHFVQRIFIVKLKATSLVQSELDVRVVAKAPGPAGAQVGRAADCDARDPATGLIRLRTGIEEHITVRVDDDFDGPEIEVQVLDAGGTGVKVGSKKLKNKCMD